MSYKGEPILYERGKLDGERALELYRKGMSDHEIAEACDVKRSTVSTWRRKKKLEANRKPNLAHKRSGRRVSKLSQDAADARAMGMNYGQYKAQMFVAQKSAEVRR